MQLVSQTYKIAIGNYEIAKCNMDGNIVVGEALHEVDRRGKLQKALHGVTSLIKEIQFLK